MRLPRTRRQAEILAAITRLTIDGVPPSLDELAAATGFVAKSGVQQALVRMGDAGLVSWAPGRARSLVVTVDDWVVLENMASADLQALRIRVDVILAERASP